MKNNSITILNAVVGVVSMFCRKDDSIPVDILERRLKKAVEGIYDDSDLIRVSVEDTENMNRITINMKFSYFQVMICYDRIEDDFCTITYTHD